MLHKQDAGDTPYEDTGAALGINDRDSVKASTTRAKGVDDGDSAMSSRKTEGITNVMFDALELTCAELYLDLRPFVGSTH